MNDTRPIGIFDSGVGGLTVLDKIRKALPGEDIIYFGDTARVPYGNKSEDTVTRFAIESVIFLMKFRVKLIVIACNTASSLSLDVLKNTFQLPIIDVITAGVNEAVKNTKNKRIGAIGTKATITSLAYKKEIERKNSGIKVFQEACPLFVSLVENGWINNKVAMDVAKAYLGRLKSKKIDTLILGCTHYPLLKPVIGKVMGKKVRLIDSAEAVASKVRRVLEEKGLKRNGKKGRLTLYVSDDPKGFRKMARLFLKCRVNVKKIGL